MWDGLDQLDAAFQPVIWISQASLLAAGIRVEQIALLIENRNPHSTGAQINSERQ